MLGWEEGEDVYVLLIGQPGQCPTATHITIPSAMGGFWKNGEVGIQLGFL